MRSYRCFLLIDCAIAGVEIIEAETDVEAMGRAQAILGDSGPRFNGYELWDGARHVRRVRGVDRELSDSSGQIRRWRMKAEELRTAAEGFTNHSSRDYFLNSAATYEALANAAETRHHRQKDQKPEVG